MHHLELSSHQVAMRDCEDDLEVAELPPDLLRQMKLIRDR